MFTKLGEVASKLSVTTSPLWYVRLLSTSWNSTMTREYKMVFSWTAGKVLQVCLNILRCFSLLHVPQERSQKRQRTGPESSLKLERHQAAGVVTT